MIFDIISKELLIAAAAWFAAQLIKCAICLVLNHSLPLNVAFGSGGMPSSHSATVCALTTSVGISCGTNSQIFALCCIFSFIVMYDAMGVRRETGEQGKAINNMIQILQDMGKPISVEKKLKELVGHTPLQVVCGAILGIIFGFVLMHI